MRRAHAPASATSSSFWRLARCCRRRSIDAALSGHSLRLGVASSAAIDEAYIHRQRGHASAEMTRSYRKIRESFTVNLIKPAGL